MTSWGSSWMAWNRTKLKEKRGSELRWGSKQNFRYVSDHVNRVHRETACVHADYLDRYWKRINTEMILQTEKFSNWSQSVSLESLCPSAENSYRYWEQDTCRDEAPDRASKVCLSFWNEYSLSVLVCMRLNEADKAWYSGQEKQSWDEAAVRDVCLPLAGLLLTVVHVAFSSVCGFTKQTYWTS